MSRVLTSKPPLRGLPRRPQAPGYRLPGNLQPGIDATESVVIDAMAYANGTAAVEVEVDIETAEVTVTRVFFVHDAGKIINPTVVEGQIVGTVAHAIGTVCKLGIAKTMSNEEHAA